MKTIKVTTTGLTGEQWIKRLEKKGEIGEWSKKFDERFVNLEQMRAMNLNNEPYVMGKAEDVKSFIQSTIDQVLKEEWGDIEKILADEINLAHTTKSGKTSRLTSAYMRIKKVLTPPSEEKGKCCDKCWNMGAFAASFPPVEVNDPRLCLNKDCECHKSEEEKK